MPLKVLTFALSLIVSVSALAEVRVFVLRIQKKGNPQDFRLVTSTLDPVQYPDYFPVKPDEFVTYDATWKCPGRTGDFKELCPNPQVPGPEKAP